MKTPQQALEAAVKKVRDRKEQTNTHPSMLKMKFISASRLVKCTARELAAEILRDDDSVDPSQVHWSTNGNALAAMNLVEVRCQEPSLRAPIPGTAWTLTGHADGLAYFDADGNEWDWPALDYAADDETPWWGTVYENKAPLHDYDDADIEKAYRQGLLYLAMATTGADSLRPAAWLQDADSLPPWNLPTRRSPGQVVVCLTPYDSPKREIVFPVNQDAVEKHLDRMIAKACVVIAAVEADDVELAVAWDDVKDRGLGEFDLTTPIPVLNDEAAAVAVKEEREANEAKKAAEARHDAAKAVLERFLKAHSLQEAKLGDYRVVLERKRGGIRHFLVDDSVSLRVYGGPKKTKTAAVPVNALIP